MKNKIKKIYKKIVYGPLAPIFAICFAIISDLEYKHFDKKWKKQGREKPDCEEVNFVKDNVTIIFKSFERQKMAKRLYRNIQSYYPGIRVIIADDSSKPLDLQGDSLQVIQLPFNSGLSYGLNRALEKVETPYVMRLDDDELLTVKTALGAQVKFLEMHPEVDLVSFCALTAIWCVDPDKVVSEYAVYNMQGAPKPLSIPHMTQIDGNHFVLGKVPNRYVARTEKIRSVGWDDNIRMLDHHDFFWRAAGNLVSVIALGTAVFHYHNPFQKYYHKYRRDVDGDRQYIAQQRQRGM